MAYISGVLTTYKSRMIFWTKPYFLAFLMWPNLSSDRAECPTTHCFLKYFRKLDSNEVDLNDKYSVTCIKSLLMEQWIWMLKHWKIFNGGNFNTEVIDLKSKVRLSYPGSYLIQWKPHLTFLKLRFIFFNIQFQWC
jgi:hypothetical protein